MLKVYVALGFESPNHGVCTVAHYKHLVCFRAEQGELVNQLIVGGAPLLSGKLFINNSNTCNTILQACMMNGKTRPTFLIWPGFS